MNALQGMLVALVVPVCAWARVLHVPAEYGTIQAGLDAATPGDVVLVAPGTYRENLSMPSGVVLQSEAGPGVTTIDGSSAGSVIECIGVSSSTEIRGFHITNGTGSMQFNGRYGGGIVCWTGASPLIEGNAFSGNRATFGGAIGCRYSSWPTIRRNEIRSNIAYFEGGGIYAIDGVGGTITIHANHISSNQVIGSTSGASGGGLWVGGIDALITGNWLVENAASSPAAVGGGGGMWLGFEGSRIVTGNVLVGNTHDNLGGGTWINDGITIFESNTLYGNAAPLGGGIATGGIGTKLIRRNIVVRSPLGQGLHCTAPGTTSVACNDVWHNAGGDMVPAGCVADLGGNFGADPYFCNDAAGDLTLRADSPCLPGGNPCGVLIGALGEGCSSPSPPVAAVPATWTSVKLRYR